MSLEPRALLLEALQEALASLDPAELVFRALPPLPPKRARVVAIAIGKASVAMLEGARRRWGDRIDASLLANEGGHPIPDEKSVENAERALALAATLTPSDLLLAVISGGASALACAPPNGMTLAEKRAVVADLLERGASIRDVNLVRRHLSRIKGGRLGAAANGARVLTMIASDVIDGAPHDVGSGPTVPDPTTLADALAILGDHPAAAFASASIEAGAFRARAVFVARPIDLAAAVAASLTKRGVHARVAPPDEEDVATTVARRLEIARALAPNEAVVIACEPTIALPRDRGEGGRAGYVALAALRSLPAGVTLLCAASDGVDGSSGASGACVDASITDPSIDDALTRFDDASFHRRAGSHVHLARGHNLADVHVLFRRD